MYSSYFPQVLGSIEEKKNWKKKKIVTESIALTYYPDCFCFVIVELKDDNISEPVRLPLGTTYAVKLLIDLINKRRYWLLSNSIVLFYALFLRLLFR